MSEIKRKLASVRKVINIEPIKDADKIELITVDGWKVIAQKGLYSVGDRVVYFEVDSFLPIRPEFEFLRPSSFRTDPFMGEGEASYKRAVLEADGALAQKLKTYENVMERFAAEFGKQKWVPDIQFGATPGGASGNEASKLIEMLSVKAAKDLSLDLDTKTPTATKKQ